jgi:hypothetical protein
MAKRSLTGVLVATTIEEAATFSPSPVVTCACEPPSIVSTCVRAVYEFLESAGQKFGRGRGRTRVEGV